MSGSGKTVESQVSHLWPVQTRTAEIVSVYGGLSAWWQSSYLHTRTQELTEYKYLYLWFRHWPWVRPLQHYSNRKQVTIWTVFVFALRITYMGEKRLSSAPFKSNPSLSLWHHYVFCHSPSLISSELCEGVPDPPKILSPCLGPALQILSVASWAGRHSSGPAPVAQQ